MRTATRDHVQQSIMWWGAMTQGSEPERDGATSSSPGRVRVGVSLVYTYELEEVPDRREKSLPSAVVARNSQSASQAAR